MSQVYQSLNIEKLYGQPIVTLKPKEESLDKGIPAEVRLYKSTLHPSGVVSYARYDVDDIWHKNQGERFLLSNFLTKKNRVTI